MQVLFGYERVRNLFRLALPLVLGVDMLHSFYYVGCMYREKQRMEAEKARKVTLYSTGVLFKRISRDCLQTDYAFWPEEVSGRIAQVALPDLTTRPKLSYELDDDDPAPIEQNKTSLVVYRLKEWTPAGGRTEDVDVTTEEISISPDETPQQKLHLSIDFASLASEIYEMTVPFPIRHPYQFCQAVRDLIAKEIRLHLKKSDGYFSSRGAQLRRILNLPPFCIERRSALRFQVRSIN